jgi:hypothetical protein
MANRSGGQKQYQSGDRKVFHQYHLHRLVLGVQQYDEKRAIISLPQFDRFPRVRACWFNTPHCCTPDSKPASRRTLPDATASMISCMGSDP